MIVAVIVAVGAPVIVAVHVNGNDPVEVIDPRGRSCPIGFHHVPVSLVTYLPGLAPLADRRPRDAITPTGAAPCTATIT